MYVPVSATFLVCMFLEVKSCHLYLHHLLDLSLWYTTQSGKHRQQFPSRETLKQCIKLWTVANPLPCLRNGTNHQPLNLSIINKCHVNILTSLRCVLMSYPPMTAVPELIDISPVSILNVVVLPAPLNDSQTEGDVSHTLTTSGSMLYCTYH